MTDYKFGWFANKFERSYENCLASLKTPELNGVVNAYVSNMLRVRCLVVFPIITADYVFRPTIMISKAAARAYSKAHEESIETEQQFSEKIFSLLRDPAYFQEVFAQATASNDQRLNLLFDFVNNSINTEPWYKLAIEQLFAATITGTWTAFETLAGDLWEIAVDSHPHRLAQLAGQKRTGAAKDGNKEKDPGKMIPFSLLELYNFDLRSVMGSVQRKMKKVVFAKLDEIREAYADAFGKEDPMICQILNDQSLDNLSIIRNLLVHKAGVCDQEYKDRVQNRPTLPQLKLTEKIEFDGQFVGTIVNEAIVSCIRLIEEVDNWLSRNLPAEAEGSGI